jgi:hypothetical protein
MIPTLSNPAGTGKMDVEDTATVFLYKGHVWMEVLVLVYSKVTPKLTLWSQTHVLVWC